MNERALKRALLGLGICFMLVFCLTPFVYMIVVSLGRTRRVLPRSWKLFPMFLPFLRETSTVTPVDL